MSTESKSDATTDHGTPGIGDVLGPRYLGNAYYGDPDRIPTNYGVATIDRETIWRYWNGAKQEVIGGHFQARCPCCHTEHVIEGTTDEDRAEFVDTILDCCDELRWLPPSDYLDPCPVCGRAHRESHECTAPAYRDPMPDFDHPAACTDCGWSIQQAENIPTHDGRCPECDSAAVRVGPEETDGDSA